MPGEADLSKLIQQMRPELNAGEYVFSLTQSRDQPMLTEALCVFRESEGITMILSKERADQAKLPYSATYAWITLTVHSSLEAVGLTAVVSQALTQANISCNVVAANYHDHLFVPFKDAERAMNVLQKLTRLT
jgi:uncharacterized protein